MGNCASMGKPKRRQKDEGGSHGNYGVLAFILECYIEDTPDTKLNATKVEQHRSLLDMVLDFKATKARRMAVVEDTTEGPASGADDKKEEREMNIRMVYKIPKSKIIVNPYDFSALSEDYRDFKVTEKVVRSKQGVLCNVAF